MFLSCVDGSISFKKCFNTIFPAVFHLNNKDIYRNHVHIKMNLREVGGGGDWMELAQDRNRWRALMNKVMNLRVP